MDRAGLAVEICSDCCVRMEHMTSDNTAFISVACEATAARNKNGQLTLEALDSGGTAVGGGRTANGYYFGGGRNRNLEN